MHHFRNAPGNGLGSLVRLIQRSDRRDDRGISDRAVLIRDSRQHIRRNRFCRPIRVPANQPQPDRFAHQLAMDPDDVFSPFGFSGTKKLKDFFIDEKIPYWKRDAIPLLCSGKEILWIPGYRRSDKALVDEETKEIVCVEERR